MKDAISEYYQAGYQRGGPTAAYSKFAWDSGMAAKRTGERLNEVFVSLEKLVSIKSNRGAAEITRIIEGTPKNCSCREAAAAAGRIKAILKPIDDLIDEIETLKEKTKNVFK